MRNQAIGFVFQNYNLLPRMPALRQVELPLIYRGAKTGCSWLRRAAAVGLGDRMPTSQPRCPAGSSSASPSPEP